MIVDALVVLAAIWLSIFIYLLMLKKEKYFFIPIWPGTSINVRLNYYEVEIIMCTIKQK